MPERARARVSEEGTASAKAQDRSWSWGWRDECSFQSSVSSRTPVFGFLLARA